MALRVQGQALRVASQLEAAPAAFERSLELLADDPYESARTQVQLGLALRDGDTEGGRACCASRRRPSHA